jgi:hypothetical protein
MPLAYSRLYKDGEGVSTFFEVLKVSVAIYFTPLLLTLAGFSPWHTSALRARDQLYVNLI